MVLPPNKNQGMDVISVFISLKGVDFALFYSTTEPPVSFSLNATLYFHALKQKKKKSWINENSMVFI